MSPEEPRTSCSSPDERFTQIWLQHRAAMLRLCRRCTRQEADAEEAFSRASLLLYRKLPAFHDRLDNLRGWILRLTFNVCMSLHRENRRRAEQSLEELDMESGADASLLHASSTRDPEASYLQKEMGHFLRSSIDNLPERLRDTIIGHLSLDSYREIADHLSINEANARKRMQEARETLAQGLAQYRTGSPHPPAPRRPTQGRQTAGASTAGDPAERVRALRAIAVNLPQDAESEGLLALRQPLCEEPRRALERYIDQHPRSSKRLALARALLEEGRAEEALPHLERGVEKQPRQLAAWLDLIAVYRLQKRPTVAACACERALATNRGLATPLLQGLHALCLGDKAAAERSFLEARGTAPESSAPWVALAELQGATGRPVEAAHSLEEALARCPTDVAALTLGAEPLRLLGRSAEARRRDARAVEADVANPPALERLLAASARSAGGRLAPGGTLWNAVRRLAQTRAAARSLLSYIQVCGGDLAGAGEMASYVADRPRLPQAHAERARLLDAVGRPLSALQELDVARTLQTSSRDLDLLACRISVRAGLPSRALQECDNLLTRHGDAWDTASTIAWALAHLGRISHAIELSQAAVERQSALPAAWLEHGRVLTRAERLEDAIAAIEMGLSLLPEGDGFDLAAPAALDLAVLHRRLDQSKAAGHWARKALEVCVMLAQSDPVQSHVLRARIQAECSTEVEADAGGSAGASSLFLRIEERRLLTSQISETFS